MTDRLQQTFSARAGDLPREAQTLLLLAALNDRKDVGEIVAAARLISAGIAEEHLAPAAAAGLLLLRGTTLEFRHPLVRSAVYETATIEERRGLANVYGASLGLMAIGIGRLRPPVRTETWLTCWRRPLRRRGSAAMRQRRWRRSSAPLG